MLAPRPPSRSPPTYDPHSTRCTAGCHTSRDFVPWRFSDAGRRSAWIASSCRRPKTCTRPDLDLARARTKTICPFPKTLDDLVQSIGSLQMIISSQIFEAYLECPTKCWLRSRAEPITGNFYAEWARLQNETYLEYGLKRSFATVPESDRATAPPIPKNPKDVTWCLAIDVRWRTREQESRLQAVERIPSDGHGRS